MQVHLLSCRSACVACKKRGLQPLKLEQDFSKLLSGKHPDFGRKSLPAGGGGFATAKLNLPHKGGLSLLRKSTGPQNNTSSTEHTDCVRAMLDRHRPSLLLDFSKSQGLNYFDNLFYSQGVVLWNSNCMG
jgi:hypothetical protein